MSSSIPISSFKRFGARIFWLVLFLFLFDRGLFYLTVSSENRFYRDPGFAGRFQEFLKDKHFSTLILGTSRTFAAFQPYSFEKLLGQEAFIEARSGKGLKYNWLFYEFYKRCAGPPKVVVYGVDYFIFQTESKKRWLARFDAIPETIAPFSAPSLLLKNKDDIEDFLVDIIARMGLAEDKAFRATQDFIKAQDYVGRETSPGKLITQKPRNLHLHRYWPYPGKEGPYLKQLLEEWERDGVTVLMVIIPDYIGTYETNFEQQKSLNDLRRLTRDHPNVHIYNFNRPNAFPLEKEKYFFNGGWGRSNSHLSKEGVEVFNRLLLKKIAVHYRRTKISKNFRRFAKKRFRLLHERRRNSFQKKKTPNRSSQAAAGPGYRGLENVLGNRAFSPIRSL